MSEDKSYWQDEELVKECGICSKVFSLMNRKHHCRCCGFVYCASCSATFAPLPSVGIYVSVRICDKCNIKIKLESMFAQKYGTLGEARRRTLREKKLKEEPAQPQPQVQPQPTPQLNKNSAPTPTNSNNKDNKNTTTTKLKKDNKEMKSNTPQQLSSASAPTTPTKTTPNKNNKQKGIVQILSEKFTPQKNNKTRLRRESTARDEISVEAMKGILKKADVYLSEALVSQLLISFDSTIHVMAHVSSMIGAQEKEDIKAVNEKYDTQKNEILEEIMRREKYGLA